MLYFIRRDNKLYQLLVFIHLGSFLSQFLIGRNCPFNTITTYLNIVFLSFNMFLVLQPWSKIDIKSIHTSPLFVKRIESFLYPLLYCNWFMSVFIGVVVYVFMPDIREFKAAKNYVQLYDTIPGFALLFRTASVIWNFGMLAIPLVFYYASKGITTKAIKAGVLSLSTLVYSFANYSRAGIVSYTLSFVAYYFLLSSSLSDPFKVKFNKILKRTSVFLIAGFLIMTFIRFTSMTYYGDRIPKNSIIKDPIVYSIVDYISQSNENGLYCMELYKSENCLNGESFFYTPILILSTFNIIQGWDFAEFMERADKAYSDIYIMFNGYVASCVCDFGYWNTIFINLFVFIYLTYVLRRKSISLSTCLYLLLLLQLPLNSIYYNALSSTIIPYLFVLVLSFLYNKSPQNTSITPST